VGAVGDGSDGVYEGESVRGACPTNASSNLFFAMTIVFSRQKINNVHYSPSPPHKTPYRAPDIRTWGRGTSLDRGEDLDTGLSGPYTVIERGG
jgi:hypothetical protein